MEEISKLYFIRRHICENTDILKKEWDELSKGFVHDNKLLKIYTDSMADLSKLDEGIYKNIVENEKRLGSKLQYKSSFSEIVKSSSLVQIRLKKWNAIKKACFYFDWTGNEWFNASTLFKKTDLPVLAYFLFETTKYQLRTQMLAYRYPSRFFYDIPIELNVMIKDPLYQACQEFYALVYSDDFEKVIVRTLEIQDTFSPFKINSKDKKSKRKFNHD